MNDKKLLIILILLATYVLAIKPLSNQLNDSLFKLRYLEKAIEKEKFIQKKVKDIKKVFPTYMKIAKKNENLFFPANLPVSAAMSEMQKIIKKAINKNNIESISISWVTTEDKGNYLVLPISIIIKGSSQQIDNFLRDILSSKKLLRFSMFSVSHFRNKLIVRATIMGYKLKGETS